MSTESKINPLLPATIVWRTQEYEFIPKSTEWYWYVGITAGSIVVISLYFSNVLFAILTVVAAFSVMLFGARPPQPIYCEFTSQGLKLNNAFYPYKSLESFCVHSAEPPSIIIKSKKKLSPYIIIPLEYLDPDNTREFLSQYLPEEEHQIPFPELLSRRLGF